MSASEGRNAIRLSLRLARRGARSEQPFRTEAVLLFLVSSGIGFTEGRVRIRSLLPTAILDMVAISGLLLGFVCFGAVETLNSMRSVFFDATA